MVRRRHDLVDDGPFRATRIPSRIEITYTQPGESRATTAKIVAVVAPTVASICAIAGIWGGLIWFDIASILFTFFVMALAELHRFKPWSRDVTLEITPETVLHHGGNQLLLAEVRRVEVARAVDGHAVSVETAGHRVVVATTHVAEHAAYIAGEIDSAYRAFLRKRTES